MNVLSLRLLAAAGLIVLSLSSAFGFDQEAKRLFENGMYEETITRLESDKKYREDMGNVMLLTFSNLQLYNFTNHKHFKSQYESYYDTVVAKARVDDLSSILYFATSEDKPAVIKNSRKLLKTLFENLYKVEDIAKISPFLQASDQDVKKLALDSIYRIIDPIRDVVNDGGTMRPKDVACLSDKSLIKAVLTASSESRAQKILVLIEEPSLEFLDAEGGKEVAKIRESVNAAVAKRKKKFPQSNWYSATGKVYTPQQ